MKTNLLKIALGLFLLTITVSNVKAQVTVGENFDYPVGALIGKNGGYGWAGPWIWNEAKPSAVLTNGEVVDGNVNGNVTGRSLKVAGDKYVGGDNPAREVTPILNVAGTSVWLGFSFVVKTESAHFAGISYFSGASEHMYLGFGNFGLMNMGKGFPDATYNLDDEGYIYSSGTIATDEHYYISKCTFFGGGKMRVDTWTDYVGTTEPTLSDPTFEFTCYFNNAPSITKIRLSSSADPGTGYSLFDGLRMSSTYFTKANENLPLTNVVLKAISTANGNLISWTSESQDKVASLSVERKDASGAWVNISGSLSAKATSFKDTNPLAGDNYYQLVSKDIDGTTQAYGPAFVAGLEVDATTFYPNPVTNGELNVVAGKQAINSVSLFDLAGKRVSFKANSSSASKITVNTLSLKKGVYILEVNGKKSTSRNKVVIN